VDLVDARSGALGVLAPTGGISRFIHIGLDEQTRATMGPLPEGKGLLGQLILGEHPLRLADLSRHEASVGFPPNARRGTARQAAPPRPELSRTSASTAVIGWSYLGP